MYVEHHVVYPASSAPSLYTQVWHPVVLLLERRCTLFSSLSNDVDIVHSYESLDSKSGFVSSNKLRTVHLSVVVLVGVVVGFVVMMTMMMMSPRL